MIWESNEEVANLKDKYRVTVLHHACEVSKAHDKKLPTNACLVHYLDMKKRRRTLLRPLRYSNG